MSRAQRALVSRTRRGLLYVGAVITCAGLLTSCANDAGAGGDGATVLDVNLGRFILEPAVLEAPAGDLVLRVKNGDPDMAHDLVVYGKGTRRLAPGESQTLEIPNVVPGDYRMWCDVPGHAAAGQTGTLIVKPADELAAVSP